MTLTTITGETASVPDNMQEMTPSVSKNFSDSLAKFNEDKPVGHGTRGGAPELLQSAQPFFENFTSNNNNLILSNVEYMLERLVDRFAKQSKEDKAEIYSKVSNKFVDHKLDHDKLDAMNRLDHIILHGHSEPAKNYQPNGYETQEEFEGYIIEAASNVGIDIKSEHISFAHRIGKRPVNAQGGPRLLRNGNKFARPIIFKLVKRAKKEELMRQKKNLKDNHNIKISEDQTPLRKALCEYVNEMDIVKVAYPMHGKVYVRLESKPEKAIGLDSFKDLHRIGFKDQVDLSKLKLDDVLL